MKIKIIGAAGGEVTGSCYVLETDRACVMVDCGLFQGSRRSEALNRPPEKVDRPLDAVLITHGHLDHTGRLPLLTKLGYQGPVYATPATIEMSALIVRDSARLQSADVERENRKRRRAGEEPLQPLYTPADAETILGQFRRVDYHVAVPVAPGIEATWAEAGHMLGSASIQLAVNENGRTKRVVFSGDLGPRGALILRDFEPFQSADLVFLESTYGDRDHRSFDRTVEEFAGIVQCAVETGGRLLVPTFAVGRAQIITSLLSWMFRTRKVPPFALYLDSPMAIEAANIYSHHHELFDEDALRYIAEHPLEDDLKTLRACTSVDDSKRINDARSPFLVMAGAGMCNGGRILHHLRAHLWKPDTHVLIVGYQAAGCLGRRLLDGEETITIFGEKIAVKATIHSLGGFSAHAGQTDLMAWFDVIAASKPRVVLTHGEDGSRRALAEKIRMAHGIECALPAMGDVIEL